MPDARFLVVFDADSTLIRNEVIELIADEAGRGAEVAAATEAAMRGDVDFATSLRSRVEALRGVPVVLATGYDREAIPPPYLRLPRREKPVTIADLTGALVERMWLRDDCRPPRPMARGRRK